MNRVLVLMFVVCTPAISFAHEVRPARLTITETTEDRYLVRWNVPAASGFQRVAIDPVFADTVKSDDDQVDGYSGGASVRSWTIGCPSLEGTDITFRNLPATMIDVLVQLSFLDGRYYTTIVRPNDPIFQIPNRDSEISIFSSYLVLGIEHILFGWDHLLFVLGLTILVTDRRRLFWAITGFTLAHSVTLSLAMLDIVHVPGPPVEAVIALSIILLAVETIQKQRDGVESLATRSPWLISMVIGLVHGLGFAGALSEYGLPAHAKFVSLLSFNVGVEVGQVGFILTLLLLAALVAKFTERLLPSLQWLSATAIGVIGSFWFVERVTGFFV